MREASAVHTAHQVIAELLPSKSSLSREGFVSNVLSRTQQQFTRDGDNSLSKAERLAYIQGARGMAAIVLSDGQKNQEIAKYRSRRFSDFASNIQNLAEDAYSKRFDRDHLESVASRVIQASRPQRALSLLPIPAKEPKALEELRFFVRKNVQLASSW